MHTQRIFDTVQKIRLFDGYQGKDIIDLSLDEDAARDKMLDIAINCCDPKDRVIVPIRSDEELIKELGLKEE